MKNRDQLIEKIEGLIADIKQETQLLSVDNFDERKSKVFDLINSVQRLNPDLIVEHEPPKELISNLLDSFIKLNALVQSHRATALQLSNDSFDEQQALNAMQQV